MFWCATEQLVLSEDFAAIEVFCIIIIRIISVFTLFSRSPQTTANTMGNVSPDSSLRDQETGDKDIMEKLVSPSKPVEGGEKGEDKKDEETQSISMILPHVN